MTARYCSRSVGTGVAAKRRGILGIALKYGTREINFKLYITLLAAASESTVNP